MNNQLPRKTCPGSRCVDRSFNSVVVLVLALVLVVLPVLSGGIAHAQKVPQSEATSRLFESIAEDNLQGVKINLAGGADLHAKNEQNKTPIEMAIDRGYSDIVFYLMAYRDIATKAPPARAPQAPARPVNSALPAPGSSQSAVAGVYTPPPGSSPWSATVVTSEPSVPEPKFQGPSPFEPGSMAPGSGLEIIGDIRGPSGPEPTVLNEQTVEVKVEPQPATEPVAPQVLPPAVRAPALPSTPALAQHPALSPAPAPVIQSSLAVMPLHKPRSPAIRQVIVQPLPTPPIVTVPTAVTALQQETAPLSPLFDDEIPAPALSVEPVIRAVPKIAPPAAVELVSNALITPEPVHEIQARSEPAQKLTPQEYKRVPIDTTLPGKAMNERGFFDKILQALSFGDDEVPPKQVATNRIVMDMPPLLPNRKPDQIIDDSGGWEVKKIEKASSAPFIQTAARVIPDEIDKRTVSPLTNINLSLLNDHGLGLSPPKTTSEEFMKSCIEKKSGSLVFCIVDLSWPTNIASLFSASTVLYEGTKTIVRYDEGAATYYHTLFPSQSFSGIVDYYTAIYGPPTKTVDRSIAPLASPRLPNPTVIWHSIAPVTNLLTTLELRTFDDTRGGFPDTLRGVALLYHEWSRPVFPHVSTVELMMLSTNQQR